MKKLKGIFENSYYRIRIIILFCIFTIILVLIIARASYLFVYNLYLNQLSEQVNNESRLIAYQIPAEYLNFLSLGSPTESTRNLFKKIFDRNLNGNLRSEIFIFDKNFRIIVSSGLSINTGSIDTRLLLNKDEISALNVFRSTASLPFKGDDKKWYLWGFCRISPDYWLAVKENARRLQKVEYFSSLFWYFGIGGIVLSVILGWLMARSINKPVDILVKFSSDIGRGKFNLDIPPDMHGEFGLLASAMNKMKNDLAENQKDKEELLAQIAHEIRNPLGGIELLANLTKEDLDKERMNTEYMEKILKEISALKKLISSYLNYSKPVAAKPKPVELSGIRDELKDIFYSEVKKKKAVLDFDIAPGRIFYDEEHLKQILINLVSNSLDSVNSGGTVTVTAERQPSSWKITVKDNGKGISPENINKIFNPFYTTKKNGTGLGLAICRKLSAENNSVLTVKSDNNGTAFILTKESTNGF